MATRPPIGMPKLSRRAKVLLSIAAVLIVLLLVGSRLLGTYVDWLWYGELGIRQVFTTMLLTRIGLFLGLGLLIGGVVAISLFIAYKSRPVFVPVTTADDPLARYRSTIVQRVKLFGIGIPVISGVIAGATGQGDWQLIQLALNGTSFGLQDPEFGKDVGFYAFTLPFVTWLIGWLLVAFFVAFLAAAVTHYLFGGIRVGTKAGGNFSGPARLQLLITGGLWAMVWAVSYYFDRFELMFSDRNSLFNGATYTDLNAVLPAKLILTFIAGFCALAFFAAIFIRNLQLPAIATALLLVSQILIGWAWPAVLEQFSVKPNAAEKEAKSIERNIEATKDAFGLNTSGPDRKVEVDPYEPTDSESTPAQNAAINTNTGTVPNLRLLDPSILSPTFKQNRGAENFYGFPDKLDIDRYEVDDKVQDYVVAARELDPDLLTENQTNWINKHMVYTHGEGFVAAPANRIDRAFDDGATGEQSGAQGGGYPVFTVSDLESIDEKRKMDIPLDQPRIYYGELANDYAIVNARPEFDASGEDAQGGQKHHTYAGKGGVPIDSWFDKFVFFAHYGERNFLFNGDIKDDSKIMYDRTPRERVQKAAPWLTVDGDPYPAVVDGRIVWIVDGYTTLDNYPYAKHTPLGEATTDSLTGVARQDNRDISYIRNSVKAVVDAYDGTVKLYAIDGKDPVLKAWENVFPGTVSHELLDDKSGKFDELKSHFRYPEDLFKVQRELLTRYHVDDPAKFFETNTFWSVPRDPTTEQDNNQTKQPPYYVLAQTPGQKEPTFQITSGMTLLNSNFMKSWMSVSSDWADYGKIRVLELKDRINGPVQVQDKVRNTPSFAEARTLLGVNSNQVDLRYGNLLSLPVADGFLYMEPLYIQQRTGNSFPQLARVVVYFGGEIGIAPTVQGALQDVFETSGGATPPGTEQPPDTEDPPPDTEQPPTTGISPELTQALADLDAAEIKYKQARQNNDYAAEGQALSELLAAIDKVRAAGGGGG